MQLKFGAFSKKCNVIINTLIIVKKSIKDIYEEIIIVHRTHYRSFFVWPSIYSISMLSKPQIISLKVKQIIIHRICWTYKRKQLEIRCNQINKKKISRLIFPLFLSLAIWDIYQSWSESFKNRIYYCSRMHTSISSDNY